MYLKIIKSHKYQYLKICRSYRDTDGKVHQKVVSNIGRLDILQQQGLEKIVYAMLELVSPEKKGRYKDISTMEEVHRWNYGFVAYAKLWNSLGISQILRSLVKNRKIGFDFEKVVFSLVVNRLLAPSSKLYHFNHKDRYLFLNEEIELHDFYRALDLLAEHKEDIEYQLFERGRDLLNMQLDVVFYDVTTYYFESRERDALRDFGFSKDHKINEVQVVMGLLIDKEGRPIGYELFRGNTADSTTLVDVLKKLREKFKIERVIFVADRGLNSQFNLKELKEQGFDYVISSRLKHMPEPVVARVLELEGYQEAGGYMYKEIGHTRQVWYVDEQGEKRSMEIAGKWICTYSGIRAEKDRRDRERLIQKAMEIVERGKKSVVEHKTGHRRYIQKEFKEGDGSYQLKLDEAKIEADARYDGYYVIETSHLDIHPIDVLEIYHNLWKVEESFRVMKSTMQVRPIFHWTPRRIEGHFVMSFIAFLLGRELEIRLKKNRKTSGEISMERIKEAINTLEVSEIEVEGERLFLKGKHDMLAGKIWDVLRIEQLGRVSSLEEIRAWYSRYTVG